LTHGKSGSERRSNDVERERRCSVAPIVSVLLVDGDCVDGQDSRREQLLALFSVRRGLESRSSHVRVGVAVATMMTPDTAAEESTRAQTVRELYELIAALDRRVPQVERVGEVSIARAASALRLEALKRIEELERENRSEPV
jgi:hypothetical protein